MNALQENPLVSRLAKPLGEKSLSSSLTTALKVAEVILSIAFAFGLVAAVFSIGVAILVATQVVPAEAVDAMAGTPWTVRIPSLVYAVVAARGALLIVRRLKKVFASFVANEPFAPDNATHLRSIWVTLVVIEIARIATFVLILSLSAAYASGAEVTWPFGLGNPIDFVRWFVIFVVMILVEVFRQGTLLREDHELTV